MRGVTAGDVARRDLGRLQLGFGDRQRRARRTTGASMPSIVPACAASTTTTWPCDAGFAGVEHRLAVEAEVAVALLDHAVGLARDHEAVVAETDVERLPAAAQREQDPVGFGAGDRADRDRALERRDRRTERFVGLDTRRDAGGTRARG